MAVPRLSGTLAALLVATACTVPPERKGKSGIPCSKLSEIDEGWFRTVMASDEFKRYLGIPAGSIHLKRIPRETLSRLAMVESFISHPDWGRIWYVAELCPDECVGVAILNYLVMCEPDNFVASNLDRIPTQADSRGLEAAVFAHIQDEPSRPSPYNPVNWIGDLGGYHLNAYLTCAEFLSERNRSYMAGEWERLSRFHRNGAIARVAGGCLAQSRSRDGSEGFARVVNEAREFHERFLGQKLFAVSTHDLLEDKREVREFEIRFYGKHEPLTHHVWCMFRIRPKYVNHGSFLLLRVPKWPHKVTMEGSASYLDRVQDVFEVLDSGETGEVRMKYSTFLIVRGTYSPELEAALPPYTRLGLVPKKQLLVLSVLNENLEKTRCVLKAHAYMRVKR